MNDSTQQKAPHGRSFQVLVFGGTAAELEQAALDEARAFFGDGLILRVVPDYEAMTVRPHGSLIKEAGGKKHQAHISVLAVPPGLPPAGGRLCALLRGLRSRVQAGRP